MVCTVYGGRYGGEFGVPKRGERDLGRHSESKRAELVITLFRIVLV